MKHFEASNLKLECPVFKSGKREEGPERCFCTVISRGNGDRNDGPWTDPDIVQGDPGLFLEAPYTKSFRRGKARTAPGHFLLNTLHSNSLISIMTATTLLQGGLYSIGCLDILNSVAGCVSLPLSKSGHLV